MIVTYFGLFLAFFATHFFSIATCAIVTLELQPKRSTKNERFSFLFKREAKLSAQVWV